MKKLTILACCFLATPILTHANDRDDLSFGLNVGYLFDFFEAADDKVDVSGDEDTDDSTDTAYLAVNAEYQLNSNFWLTGRTLRTSQSVSIDCGDEGNQGDGEACGDSASLPTGVNFDDAVAIIRDAESIEGFLGLRWEPAFMQRSSGDNPGQGYVRLEAGFASVEDSNNDLAEKHSLMLGLLVTKGDYQGSFIEVGIGKNELFEEEPDDRLKFKAHLEKQITTIGEDGKPLMLIWELSGDTDLGDGSDSLRTMLGFNIPL